MIRRILLVAALICTCSCNKPKKSTPKKPPAPKVELPLKLAPIFGSNMVLQSEQRVPIFGKTTAGSRVTVRFGDHERSTRANPEGGWSIRLPPMKASRAHQTLTVESGKKKLELRDVRVGEVWLCSGQSNMGWPMHKADGTTPYIEASAKAGLSLFKMGDHATPSKARWELSSPQVTPGFSAVCYFMGLDASESLNVPVGLIQATFGGSKIERWTHAMGGDGAHYDAMVRPLQPFAIRGVLWYQGESNGQDSRYAERLESMLAEWRQDWQRPSLPFGIIQVPLLRKNAARYGQALVAQRDPRSHLIVAHDLPGNTDLHPTAKYELGIRSSIWARGAVYDQGIEPGGPQATLVSQAENRRALDIAFVNIGEGLATSDNRPPGPFELAGADGQWHPAQAKINGSTVVVSSAEVSEPLHVRYAFSGVGNLVNRVAIDTEGKSTVKFLPANLFQLDRPPLDVPAR